MNNCATERKVAVMERWLGRVAVVTGASQGIGRAIATALVEHGMTVVGCARNMERLQATADSLNRSQGKFLPVQCDIGDEGAIQAMFDVTTREYGGVDVMINNAAFSPHCSMLEGTPDQWLQMCKTNLVGSTSCTQKAIRSMHNQGVTDGIIVTISSEHSLTVPEHCPHRHFYSVCRHAMRAAKTAFRQELKATGSTIRVADLYLGLVHTRDQDTGKKIALEASHSIQKELEPNEVTDTVLHMLSAPPHIEMYDVVMGNK